MDAKRELKRDAKSTKLKLKIQPELEPVSQPEPKAKPHSGLVGLVAKEALIDTRNPLVAGPIGTLNEGTMNLQAGDLVQLKSGGPIMTIKSISDGEVRVDYFLNGKREFVDFAPSQLKRAHIP